MREIKFRAWDEENEIMCIPEFQASFNEGRYPINKFFDNSLSDKFIFMQYTGLKDKDGKEIYFGDILVTSNTDKSFDIWGKKDNGYTIVQEDEDVLGVCYSDWWLDLDDENSIYYKDFVEVIGNIYNNPELIK